VVGAGALKRDPDDIRAVAHSTFDLSRAGESYTVTIVDLETVYRVDRTLSCDRPRDDFQDLL
jgi:hypothetical protein